MEGEDSEYYYANTSASHTTGYIFPAVERILRDSPPREPSIFELGCGNGETAQRLVKCGFRVTAVDASESGIRQALARDCAAHFEVRSAYDDLAAEYGQFPVVISLEVVEHLYYPRLYAKNVFRLVQQNGVAIISTPYHGYFKNLAIALTGSFDEHWSPLWDHGHIKFWSKATLGRLLVEAGFFDVKFRLVGRVPLIAKSMVAIARKS